MESEVEFIEFRDDLAEHFAALNIAWLNKYFVIEPIDMEIFSAPKKNIIDKGGYIFFAVVDGVIAGTFAFIKTGENVYELAKMAVDEAFQGNKIGNRMMEFCIDEAKILGAKKIILYSNTKLQPAIHLYYKYGFVEIPLGNSGYQRSNIKLELVFNQNS